MYQVKIINQENEMIIHNSYNGQNAKKFKSGSIVKGINTIDSFSFAIYPNNPGFSMLNEYTTRIEVFNTKKNKYEFQGRVLKPKNFMDSNGLVYKEVVCESCFGYLCDSKQKYVAEKNWTVEELFTHIIECHNSQVEDYKKFKIGKIEVTEKNDNIYIGIQRETTWKTINDKLISTIGGEVKFRKEEDGLYIDYLLEIGYMSNTTIELAKNMKSISKESDPTSFISRLIPLGAKLKVQNDQGTQVDSEERVGIESVNGGLDYIDDVTACNKYGIIVGYAYFDDITEPSDLLTKGYEYLKENNKIHNKFSISAVDLSLIGKAVDDFDVGNYHLIKNKLINVEEILRITKKTVNIISPTSSTLEFGDTFKSLSDIQINNNVDYSSINGRISVIENNYTTNDQVVMIVDGKINDVVINYETDKSAVSTNKIIDGKIEYVKRINFGSLPNSDIKKVPLNLNLNQVIVTDIKAFPRTKDGKTSLFPFLVNDSPIKLYFDSTDNTIVIDSGTYDVSEYEMKVDVYFIND